MKIMLPIDFIGDIPRQLFSSSEWRAIKIDIKDAQCGDLLFVKNRKKVKLLSHVALVIGVDKIFHCCPLFGTAVIQSNEDFFTLYEQTLSFKEMIGYIDPRNKQLRKLHGGIFMK